MQNGYVCLWRKSLNSLVFGNEKCWKIWTWCLMRANFKENTFLLGRNKITIKPGQFVMGLKKTSEELDLAVSTIHYWLSFLEDEGMVELKKTNKYTIITILNWKDYQGLELKKNSNQNANGTLKETNNNDNNDNKHIVRDFTSHTGKEIKMEVASEYVPDGFSPLQVKQAKKIMERVMGKNKTNKWSQLLFGSAWDFIRAYQNFQGQDYVGDVITAEWAKTLAGWYERGETRETIQGMIVAFFQSDKASKITITPNSVFSAHTYNSWKQGKLKQTNTKKWL